MRENVGSMDRAVRAVAGPLLMAYGVRHRDSPKGVAALIAGAAISETALTKVCPINAALGVNTKDVGGDRDRDYRVKGSAARPDMERTEGMPRPAAYGDGRPAPLVPAPD